MGVGVIQGMPQCYPCLRTRVTHVPGPYRGHRAPPSIASLRLRYRQVPLCIDKAGATLLFCPVSPTRRIAALLLLALWLPAILHWDFNHFVVLVKLRRDEVLVHDPARGARWIKWAALSKHFTGAAMELTPEAGFRPREEQQRVRPREHRPDEARALLEHPTDLLERLQARRYGLARGAVCGSRWERGRVGGGGHVRRGFTRAAYLELGYRSLR